MIQRIMKQRKGYEKVVLICLELLLKMNTNKAGWVEKAHKDVDRIKNIILDMNKNRNEEHVKVMKYLNKIAKLCYSEENEERQDLGTLLHCLTYKLKCKNIKIMKDWLERITRRYQNDKTQQYILNRKNSGSILQNAYEDIKAARVNQ